MPPPPSPGFLGLSAILFTAFIVSAQADLCHHDVQLLQTHLSLQRNSTKLPCTAWHVPALSGFDVTSFFNTTLMAESGPVLGRKEFSASFGTSVFWFSSEFSKQQFEADPKAFLPQYGGFCPFAVADPTYELCDWPAGEVSKNSYVIFGGRLFFFYLEDAKISFMTRDDKDYHPSLGMDEYHSSLAGLTRAQIVEQADKVWENAIALSEGAAAQKHES